MRFVEYFDEIDFSNMEGQVTSSRMCILDLRNKCIATHYTVSYSDPRVVSYNDGSEGGCIAPGEKRIVHYYIHYDYARDQRTIRERHGFVPTARDDNGVFPQLTTENPESNQQFIVPPFPHPIHVHALPKFPLADYAAPGQGPAQSDKGKEPESEQA